MRTGFAMAAESLTAAVFSSLSAAAQNSSRAKAASMRARGNAGAIREDELMQTPGGKRPFAVETKQIERRRWPMGTSRAR